MTPGTYTVVLDYGGHKTRQNFVVSLDPRIHSTPRALDAQLALAMQIHDDLNWLDTALNQAISARNRLRKMLTGTSHMNAKAAEALATLNQKMANDIQMDIHSSEGDALHQVHLRGYLSYLASDVEWPYARPTVAEYHVFQYLDQQTSAAVQQLRAAIAAAGQVAN